MAKGLIIGITIGVMIIVGLSIGLGVGLTRDGSTTSGTNTSTSSTSSSTSTSSTSSSGPSSTTSSSGQSSSTSSSGPSSTTSSSTSTSSTRNPTSSSTTSSSTSTTTSSTSGQSSSTTSTTGPSTSTTSTTGPSTSTTSSTSSTLTLPPMPVVDTSVVVDCPYNTGIITYTILRDANPTADQLDAYQRIQLIMDGAIKYYMCFTNFSKVLQVGYDPVDTPTAGAWFDGRILFGADRQYMTLRVALHELAHTNGMGTVMEWYDSNLNTAMNFGIGMWIGLAVNRAYQENVRLYGVPYGSSSAGYITWTDGPHFSPYGLLQDWEIDSLNVYIAHCRMMMAFRQDMGF